MAYDNVAFEAESAKYTLKENSSGELVLTLFADNGTISYIKRSLAANASTNEPVSSNPETGVGGISAFILTAFGAGALMIISGRFSKVK